MRRRTIVSYALAAAAAAACGTSDDRPHAATPGSGGQAPSGGGGAASTGGGTAGGADGGSDGGADACGNGIAGPNEDCDGTDLKTKTCADVGFETGTLVCADACTFDRTACSGTERCTDNKDNDGDDARDCDDTDCQGACADPCAVVPSLVSGVAVQGNTQGHVSGTAASCYNDEAVAPPSQIIYTITPAQDGVLEVRLTSDANMALSIRVDCASIATETLCLDGASGHSATEFLSHPATNGQPLFVVVDAEPLELPNDTTSDVGIFSLEAVVRPIVCGDYIVDAGEQCDDGNQAPTDGCDAACQVVESGTEPNDTRETASPLAEPYFGAIAPEADVDFIAVTLTAESSTILASTFDFGDGGCALDKIDTVLDVLNDQGDVLASDDDGGDGLCASVVASGLGAGTHYIAVYASPEASFSTFGYRLDVTVEEDTCGDGAQTLGEQCDDNNVTPGDGCGATCLLELAESEPNDTPGSASPYSAPHHATISPAGDIDVVTITVAANGTDLRVSTSDGGDGTCWTAIDTIVEILASNGTTVLATDDDGGVGYCSLAEAPSLSAGVYYARVKPTQLVAAETFPYELVVEFK